MKIVLKFHSSLKRFVKSDNGELVLEVEKIIKIEDVIKSLNIKYDEIGLIVQNSKVVKEDVEVKPKGRIEFFPFFGGG